MQQSALELVKVEYGQFRAPEKVVQEAAHVARVFKEKMELIRDEANQPILYRMFGPSRHITKPGWQLLGSMFRVTAGIVDGSVKYVEYGEINGFEATAQAIYVPTGGTISTAVAMCLNDEDNWDQRPVYEWKANVKKQVGERAVPLFQLASMAQTRACSKVLSNLLAYVATMAGCSGTAAEEVGNKNPEAAATGAADPQPQRAQNGTGLITDAQVGRLFGLSKQNGRSREDLGVILAAHGYSAPSNASDPVDAAARLVKKGDFDKIQEAILKP